MALPPASPPLRRLFLPMALALAMAAAPARAAARALYPGVTAEQNALAHRALGHLYGAELRDARRVLEKMRLLEEAEDLPPLSYLLSMASAVMLIQNGDYPDRRGLDSLRRAAGDLASRGIAICRQRLAREPDHPTFLLVQGGISGFLATLKIHGNPSQALNDGFQALRLLERALDADPDMKDCYLGTGIFNCGTANAPLYVRATIKLFGRTVSMAAGLRALRVSAYQGQYTTAQSQLLLIQFLSPYDEETRREKEEIFRSLGEAFPRNPYHAFLENDEALSFYPDSCFQPAWRASLEERLGRFHGGDFYSRRYLNLVKWQYALIAPKAEARFRPDSLAPGSDFAYYPVFLQGVGLKRRIPAGSLEESGEARDAALEVAGLRDSCLKLIAASDMSASRKRYYGWHVRDGLRLDPPKPRPRRKPPADPDRDSTVRAEN